VEVVHADIYPRAESVVKTDMRISVMSMVNRAGVQTGSGGCDSGSRDSEGSHLALANHAV